MAKYWMMSHFFVMPLLEMVTPLAWSSLATSRMFLQEVEEVEVEEAEEVEVEEAR